MSRPRLLLGWASVGFMMLVSWVALTAAPAGLRWWLAVPAVVGVMMAVPAAFSESRDLTPALLLSLAPVVALLSEGSPAWLVPPLASLLLVAAELNAMSWAGQGVDDGGRVLRRRLAQVGQLALLGVAGSAVVVGFGQLSWLSGTMALLVAAAAVAGIGSLVWALLGGGESLHVPEGLGRVNSKGPEGRQRAGQ